MVLFTEAVANNSKCGKKEAHTSWSMVTCKGSTRRYYWNYLELLALCRRTLTDEHHRYAIIARPDKLGTDPMAYGVLNRQMDAAGRRNQEESNPLSRHQIQPGVENEQADAGRDG